MLLDTPYSLFLEKNRHLSARKPEDVQKAAELAARRTRIKALAEFSPEARFAAFTNDMLWATWEVLGQMRRAMSYGSQTLKDFWSLPEDWPLPEEDESRFFDRESSEKMAEEIARDWGLAPKDMKAFRKKNERESLEDTHDALQGFLYSYADILRAALLDDREWFELAFRGDSHLKGVVLVNLWSLYHEIKEDREIDESYDLDIDVEACWRSRVS